MAILMKEYGGGQDVWKIEGGIAKRALGLSLKVGDPEGLREDLGISLMLGPLWLFVGYGLRWTHLDMERDPDVFGGAAVIPGTKVPVFFIDQIIKDESWDAARKAYPHVPSWKMSEAYDYALQYPEKVEQDRQDYLKLCEEAEES